MKRMQYYLVALLAFALFGCKSKQYISNEPIKKISTTGNLIDDVIAVQPDIKNMNLSKISVTFDYGLSEMNFNASVKFLKDSILAFSIQPILGIEAYRIQCTTQGIEIYDKFKQRYAKEDYDYFYKKLGITVDFNAIQGIATNQLFTLNKYKLLKNDLSVVHQSDTSLIKSHTAVHFDSLYFKVADKRVIGFWIGSSLNDQRLLSVRYTQFEYHNDILYPMAEQVVVVDPRNNISKAEFVIKKATFNNDLVLSPINISKYTKVSLSNILP